MFINKIMLLIPAFWACLCDLLVTSINQPAEYWNGDLQAGWEGNPIADVFMKNHNLGIFIFVLLWLTVIVTIGYFLRPKLFRILSLFVLIAHTWGASTWIGEFYGFWYIIAFVLFNSIFFIIMEDRYTSKNIELEKK